MRISVLDQSPIVEGSSGQEALANTLDLARLTDRLGFHRYWVAEHHGGPMLASPSPEVLIGPIAAAIERIRVGSGGVMLPHYSPLKVAENFSMLAGLAPGRIDLGIGRALRPDGRIARCWRSSATAARPPPTTSPTSSPSCSATSTTTFRTATPSPATRSGCPAARSGPDFWLLGSSPQSALWAAELGAPYSFADFINPRGAAIAADYRERFRAGRRATPEVSIGVWALAADSDEEARLLATSARMAMTLLRQGRLIEVPTVERAVRFLEQQGSPLDGAPRGRRTIVGTAESPRRDRAGAGGVRRAGGGRRDDHARPRGASPLLRADRRRLRPENNW